MWLSFMMVESVSRFGMSGMRWGFQARSGVAASWAVVALR